MLMNSDDRAVFSLFRAGSGGDSRTAEKAAVLVLIPVLVLLGAAIYFAIQRNEVVTDVLTIAVCPR